MQRSLNPLSNKNPGFYRRLIEYVRENPCFYDTSNPNYRNFAFKCQLWRVIADELRYEGDMYKQWKKLRDRYVREIRKLRWNGRSKSTCKWGFLEDMEWMKPYIEEPRPLEDFEVGVEPQGTDDAGTKSIYENGKKVCTSCKKSFY